MKALLLGPLPPPIGGATVLFKELIDYMHLTDDIECKAIDTSFRGKGQLSRLMLSFFLLFRIITNIKKFDVVFFHASLRGAYQFGIFVKLICYAFGKPWGFRGFGGNYYDWYSNTNGFNKWLLRHGILSADIVLLETKQLINEFREIIKANYVWYSNSRFIQHSKNINMVCRNLVFVGHVKATKGVSDLIAIADQLPRGVVIDVYGPLMDGMQEADFKCKSVRYKGVLAPGEVYSTINKYDALVFPTYYEGEGYPGVILEAYACGIPVITTRWKMIPELVDERSGILIEPNNRDQLLGAIKTITTESSVYLALKNGAIKKQKIYDMTVWNRKFVDLCYSLDAKFNQ